MSVAPNLVIEDDKTQHFMGKDGLNVYSPEFGTFHVSQGSERWTVKHARGLLEIGFFDAIATQSTLVRAMAHAMGVNETKALEEFAQRVENWYSAS